MHNTTVDRHNATEKALFDYMNALDEYNRSWEDRNLEFYVYGMKRALQLTVGKERVQHMEQLLNNIAPLDPSSFFNLYDKYLLFHIRWGKRFHLEWSTSFFQEKIRNNDVPKLLKEEWNNWIDLLHTIK